MSLSIGQTVRFRPFNVTLTGTVTDVRSPSVAIATVTVNGAPVSLIVHSDQIVGI